MSNPNFRPGTPSSSWPEDADDEMVDTIGRLKDDMDTLSDEASNLSDEAKQALLALKDRVADLYDQLAENAGYSVDAVEEIVVTNPWTSVFVAFGLGVLTGAVALSRRRW